VNRWEQGRSTIERLLQDRRLQRVTASRDHADLMMLQARRYVGSARQLSTSDPDGAFVLAYDAARKALTAVLENQGFVRRAEGVMSR
jgi:hypothetical protein